MRYLIIIGLFLALAGFALAQKVKPSLIEVSKNTEIAGKTYTPTQYKILKTKLADDIKLGEPVDTHQFEDILKTEMELCGGIVVNDYVGDGSDIIEEFLQGCKK